MLQEKLKILPHKPGCYLMKDVDNKIIYVGKAKDLFKRVNSYFNRPHDGKTGILISNINNFEYIVTDTERESLILELNLIKKYNPKYNILLKDDKTYPYIEITNEKAPRIRIVRPRKILKKMNLYGPYPNAYAARETLELLNRLYPLRKCEKLPKDVCLYYHIKECLGYCKYKIDELQIKSIIKEIDIFLNGDRKGIIKKLELEMKDAVSNLNFERAKEIKELLANIALTTSKQKIVFKDKINRDVLGYAIKDGFLSVQIFHIRYGNLVARDAHFVPLMDDLFEYLTTFCSEFYLDNELSPAELLVPKMNDLNILKEILPFKIVIPQKGLKKEILDLANKNAMQALEDYFNIDKEKQKINNLLNELTNLLNIESASRIEIFDNSHLFGTYKVAAMVSFIDGKPAKNDYRKFNIKSDVQDDYHMMQEVIYRRYFRLLKDNLTMPNLIIVDGGIQQVNAAKEVIKSLNLNIPVFGLAKDNKHQTSQLIDETQTYDLSNNKDLFNFLTRMQNEVHRFAITFHKEIRSKGSIESILDNIKGLGPSRRKQLLTKWSSIEELKKASLEEIKSILPTNIASEVFKTIHQ